MVTRTGEIRWDNNSRRCEKVVGLVNEVPLKFRSHLKFKKKVSPENETEKATREKNNAEAQLGRTLQNNAITIRTLNNFSKARDFHSNRHDIHIESDLPKLVNLINNSRLLGFDPNRIVVYISSITDLEERERQTSRLYK